MTDYREAREKADIGPVSPHLEDLDEAFDYVQNALRTAEGWEYDEEEREALSTALERVEHARELYSMHSLANAKSAEVDE